MWAYDIDTHIPLMRLSTQYSFKICSNYICKQQHILVDECTEILQGPTRWKGKWTEPATTTANVDPFDFYGPDAHYDADVESTHLSLHSQSCGEFFFAGLAGGKMFLETNIFRDTVRSCRTQMPGLSHGKSVCGCCQVCKMGHLPLTKTIPYRSKEWH